MIGLKLYKMTYIKGQIVTINVRGDVRKATIVEDGVDSQGKVRVRPERFPMDMSVKESEIVS